MHVSESRWFENKARGTRAEDAWAARLQSKGYTMIDSTLEQDKRGMDQFALKDGRITIFDVKADGIAYQSGNIGVELFDEYDDGRTRDGWARKRVVDWYVFMCELPGGGYDCHMVAADMLYRKLDKLIEQYPVKPTSKGRDGNKTTHNLLMPINDLPEVFADTRSHGKVKHHYHAIGRIT